MRIARVIGTVVTPVQHEFFDGQKLLLVRPESPTGDPIGATVVAIDRAQAGEGDRVLLMQEGSSARTILERDDAPARAVVVGIIDNIEMNRDTANHDNFIDRKGATRA